MEIVVVKVRPSYDDKKLHVLRFLFDTDFNSDLIYHKLHEVFPNGFYPLKIERFMIDYEFDLEKKSFISVCNHSYLSHYLTSSENVKK